MLTLLFAAVLLFAPSILPAQDAAPTAPVFTPEQREKLKAAHDKALQDPKVAAARKAAGEASDTFRALMTKKAIAADPSLKPIFDKMAAAENVPGSNGGASVLTAEEKGKVDEMFLKLGSDDEIKASLAKFQDARKQIDVAVRAAMLAADPSLAPLIEAIDKSRPSQ